MTPETTQDNILTVAVTVFAEKSDRQTTVAEICERTERKYPIRSLACHQPRQAPRFNSSSPWRFSLASGVTLILLTILIVIADETVSSSFLLLLQAKKGGFDITEAAGQIIPDLTHPRSRKRPPRQSSLRQTAPQSPLAVLTPGQCPVHAILSPDLHRAE